MASPRTRRNLSELRLKNDNNVSIVTIYKNYNSSNLKI